MSGHRLKLGLMLGYSGRKPRAPVDLALEAERAGYDSIWTAEAYGSDVVSPLCWIGARTSTIKLGTALMQISARTPACVAMTAATIDHLSMGRFILGLGVSGPQVVEGWYGQPFAHPLERTREYVEIVRLALRRDGPLTWDGRHYPLPHPDGSGLGKPLKLTVHPLRADIPIYLGAEGPRNVGLAVEIADGWLPVFFSPHRPGVYERVLRDTRPRFDIACPVPVTISDDVSEALAAVKWSLAFYIGGMGAPEHNFHLNLVSRMGFEDEARRVQRLFLEGRREEAARAVPDELADEISLVGSRERIRDRLGAWRESPVTTILVGSQDLNTIRTMAELAA